MHYLRKLGARSDNFQRTSHLKGQVDLKFRRYVRSRAVVSILVVQFGLRCHLLVIAGIRVISSRCVHLLSMDGWSKDE
jgi:hypothetical protein